MTSRARARLPLRRGVAGGLDVPPEVPVGVPDAVPAPSPDLLEALDRLGEERTATVSGVPLRWYETPGEHGPAAVLVHGVPSGPALWRDVVPRLERRPTVVVELLGSGRSTGTTAGRDVSVGGQAVYLLALLRHLGVGPAVLVGHGTGVDVVAVAASRDPGACAGLVAVDTTPGARGRGVLRALAPLVRLLPGRLVAPLVARVVAAGRDGAGSARLHAEPYVADGGGAALVAQLRGDDPAEMARAAAGLARREVPAAVVHGGADTDAPDRARRLAAVLAATWTTVPGCAGWTPEEAPRLLAGLVEAVASRSAAAGTSGGR